MDLAVGIGLFVIESVSVLGREVGFAEQCWKISTSHDLTERVVILSCNNVGFVSGDALRQCSGISFEAVSDDGHDIAQMIGDLLPAVVAVSGGYTSR